MEKQRKRTSVISVGDRPSHVAGAPSTAEVLKYLTIATHLVGCVQAVSSYADGAVEYLCRELRSISNGTAELLLNRHSAAIAPRLTTSERLLLPVQFQAVQYGMLSITRDDTSHPERVGTSPPYVQMLAQICGWLLHTIEQSMFIRGQCRRIEYRLQGPLTNREREILKLMCHGYAQQAIADRLCIAPATVRKHRQHIYEQLGVHSEHDAVFAAYKEGLVWLIEDGLA